MDYINGIIASLGASDFQPNTYHIVNKNCNHFSNALCLSLCGVAIPAYINRVAAIGSTFQSTASNVNINDRYRRAATTTAPSPSFYSFLFGSGAERAVVQGNVIVMESPAAGIKKELTERQKQLLENIKKDKDRPF